MANFVNKYTQKDVRTMRVFNENFKIFSQKISILGIFLECSEVSHNVLQNFREKSYKFV